MKKIERRMAKFIEWEKKNPLEPNAEHNFIEHPPKVRAWPRDNTAGGYRVVCPYGCTNVFHTHPEGGMGFKESHCRNQPDSHRGYLVLRAATMSEIGMALGLPEITDG